MSRLPNRRAIFLFLALGVSFGGRGVLLAQGVTAKATKKAFQVLETECFVVGTQANLAAPPFADPVIYSRELWARISENDHGRFVTILGVTIDLFALYDITPGRDALGGGSAKSGLGWKPDFIDTSTPTANQRHHFAFHFFIGSFGSRADAVVALGETVNELADALSNNVGDLRLGGAAENLGQITRGKPEIILVGRRVKDGFCRPVSDFPPPGT